MWNVEWKNGIDREELETTYVFVVVESVKDVVRQTREEIDDEPTLEVIHADDFRVGDDLATGSNECRVEVEDDVDEKDYVHNLTIYIHYRQNMLTHYKDEGKRESRYRIDDEQTDVL
jgi:hypothetical protein